MTASGFSRLQKGSCFSTDFQYSGFSKFSNTLLLLCHSSSLHNTPLPRLISLFSLVIAAKHACVLSECCDACAYIKTALLFVVVSLGVSFLNTKKCVASCPKCAGIRPLLNSCRCIIRQDKGLPCAVVLM